MAVIVHVPLSCSAPSSLGTNGSIGIGMAGGLGVVLLGAFWNSRHRGRYSFRRHRHRPDGHRRYCSDATRWRAWDYLVYIANASCATAPSVLTTFLCAGRYLADDGPRGTGHTTAFSTLSGHREVAKESENPPSPPVGGRRRSSNGYLYIPISPAVVLLAGLLDEAAPRKRAW